MAYTCYKLGNSVKIPYTHPFDDCNILVTWRELEGNNVSEIGNATFEGLQYIQTM